MPVVVDQEKMDIAKPTDTSDNNPEASSYVFHDTTSNYNPNRYSVERLFTASVQVMDQPGKVHQVRALLDPSSQVNFGRQDIAKNPSDLTCEKKNLSPREWWRKID